MISVNNSTLMSTSSSQITVGAATPGLVIIILQVGMKLLKHYTIN